MGCRLMISFKRFCEVARNPINVIEKVPFSDDWKQVSPELYASLQEAIKAAALFVFVGTEEKYTKHLYYEEKMIPISQIKTPTPFGREARESQNINIDTIEEDVKDDAPATIDLPFQVCFFEVIDPAAHGTVSIKYVMENKDTGEKHVRVRQLGLLAQEISPGFYREWVLLHFNSGDYGILLTAKVSTDRELDGFLKQIERGAIASESVNEKIKVGSGKTKAFHKIRTII